MRTFVFENPGVIDPRSITTFGVSSKERAGAIGFFGTGLKYAIAVLLRLKCSIEIESGGKRFIFHTKRTTIRVDEFDLVTMRTVDATTGAALSVEALGFTTELGKTWEPWQAFRELACNCIDEGGVYFELRGEDATPQVDPKVTRVFVNGEHFERAWDERDSIILPHGVDVVEETPAMEVLRGGNNYVYYRRIRVMKLSHPSLYTYNILKKMELTEDRTMKFPFLVEMDLAALVSQAKNEAFLNAVLTATQNMFESRLGYNSPPVSPQFSNVVTALARAFHPTLNASARKLVTDNNIADFVKDEVLQLDVVDTQRMNTAVKFLDDLGYHVRKYPIVVTTHLGKSVLGRAHDGTIYISKRTMMMGTKMLTGTLLEEFLHLEHGLTDETYEMQNFLFDTIISLGERLTKTAL